MDNRLLPALLALVAASVGCGGGGGGGDTSGAAPDPTTLPAVEAAPAGGAGGTVTRDFGPAHDVSFTTPGAPQNIPLLESGSAARDFPADWTFRYPCSGTNVAFMWE